MDITYSDLLALADSLIEQTKEFKSELVLKAECERKGTNKADKEDINFIMSLFDQGEKLRNMLEVRTK